MARRLCHRATCHEVRLREGSSLLFASLGSWPESRDPVLNIVEFPASLLRLMAERHFRHLQWEFYCVKSLDGWTGCCLHFRFVPEVFVVTFQRSLEIDPHVPGISLERGQQLCKVLRRIIVRKYRSGDDVFMSADCDFSCIYARFNTFFNVRHVGIP